MMTTLNAGDTARESGMIRCNKCHNATRVERDQSIPTCPNCGNGQFEARSGPGLPV